MRSLQVISTRIVLVVSYKMTASHMNNTKCSNVYEKIFFRYKNSLVVI